MGLLERRSQNISRFRPEHGEALRRFQQEMFGPLARQLDEARFRWLFLDNPMREEGDPPVWVATHEGEVVGQQAGIPYVLKLEQEELHAAYSVDLMVRPEWRLRGVGPALTETFRLASELVVATGATDAAYKSIIRAGWSDCGLLPTFVRPFRLAKILAWRGRDNGFLEVAAHLATPGLKLMDTINSSYAIGSGTKLVPIDRFDERADRIWEMSKDDYPILARRDLRFLAWRFDQSVDRARYERFYLMRGDGPLGYVVLRRGTQLGVEVGFVVDYLCPLSWVGPVLAWSVDHFRTRDVEALVLDASTSAAESAILRLGFWKGQRASGKRLLFREGVRRPVPLTELRDPTRWFVTRADSDWDHPD